LFKRVISRLDVKNGVLVKGINLEGLRSLGDPEYFVDLYYKEKIDEIHFQDVVATLYNRDVLFGIIEKISKKVFVNVSSGGGIKNIEDVDRLLRIGVDKVVLNSAAVKNPSLLKDLVRIYGASTIAVSIDVANINNKYEVLIETGRERTGLELNYWIDKVQRLGVGEIILTEISSEGKNHGFNLKLYEEMRRKIDVQLVAHGGAGPLDNLVDLFKICNLDAVSIASLFHYNYMKPNKNEKLKGSNLFSQLHSQQQKSGLSIVDLKKHLVSKGIKIRL
tara:strand:- start:484 stop:1314 length:831 start_codon:yes stop_codon:yes gene_type:complete